MLSYYNIHLRYFAPPPPPPSQDRVVIIGEDSDAKDVEGVDPRVADAPGALYQAAMKWVPALLALSTQPRCTHRERGSAGLAGAPVNPRTP
jgi:hypothetical protein